MRQRRLMWIPKLSAVCALLLVLFSFQNCAPGKFESANLSSSDGLKDLTADPQPPTGGPTPGISP